MGNTCLRLKRGCSSLLSTSELWISEPKFLIFESISGKGGPEGHEVEGWDRGPFGPGLDPGHLGLGRMFILAWTGLKGHLGTGPRAIGPGVGPGHECLHTAKLRFIKVLFE